MLLQSRNVCQLSDKQSFKFLWKGFGGVTLHLYTPCSSGTLEEVSTWCWRIVLPFLYCQTLLKYRMARGAKELGPGSSCLVSGG
jgi:hypothetical protein